MNSLTLSRINRLKPGNGDIIRESHQGAKSDHKSDVVKNNINDNVLVSKTENNKGSYVPWWRQFPKKTKNKNAEILNELNKITDTLPDWPWINAASKTGSYTICVRK